MPTWCSTASRRSRSRRTCLPMPTSPRRPRPRSSPRARTATRWSIPTAPTAPSASSTSPIPRRPKPAGIVKIDGEPTSVAVAGGKVLAGVNTSESKAKPSGNLTVIDLASRAIEKTCDLGGQPDSVAVSKDGAFAAIAIENERDEEVNDGEIPQLPAGNLEDRAAQRRRARLRRHQDGRPDRHRRCRAARIPSRNSSPSTAGTRSPSRCRKTTTSRSSTRASGKIVAHFPPGSVTLEEVDTKKDGDIRLTGRSRTRPRAGCREMARQRPPRGRQ